MHSSQNEQDSRHHAIASKVPMLEPSDADEARTFAAMAFEISEKFDTPVLYKMCTRVAHSQSITEGVDRVVPEHKPYEKNISKYVMAPANAIRRHPFVEQRMKDIEKWSETSGINRIETCGVPEPVEGQDQVSVFMFLSFKEREQSSCLFLNRVGCFLDLARC
jgi:Indolepyruvate ferredoxin oxidoreductase, alpha and beta subunits